MKPPALSLEDINALLSKPYLSEEDKVRAVETEVNSRWEQMLVLQKPVAETHPKNLEKTGAGELWCKQVLLYSPYNPHDNAPGVSPRVKLYAEPTSISNNSWSNLTGDELVGIMFEHRTLPVGGALAVQTALRNKNTDATLKNIDLLRQALTVLEHTGLKWPAVTETIRAIKEHVNEA